MDFGDILDKWEEKPSRGKKNKKEKNDFVKWIDSYPVEDKDLIDDDSHHNKSSEFSKRNIKKMKHQDELDLHGLTTEEAEAQLNKFIKISQKRGLKKILIIHGKGTHSKGKAVLKNYVKFYLSNCTHITDFYTADNSNGGSGATFVVLKKKII